MLLLLAYAGASAGGTPLHCELLLTPITEHRYEDNNNFTCTLPIWRGPAFRDRAGVLLTANPPSYRWIITSARAGRMVRWIRNEMEAEMEHERENGQPSGGISGR